MMAIESRLLAGQLINRVWISGGRGFSVQSGSEAHIASYARVRGSFCSGVKRTVREADHLRLLQKIRISADMPPLPHTLFVAYTVTDVY
jgi:hypothetical protein